MTEWGADWVTEWAEFLAACLALFGAAFFVLASLALHRMPDIYGRLSATSKAVTIGAVTLLAAAALHTLDGGVIARALAGIAFLLLTSPIAGHMLGRAAWRSGMEAQVYYQDDFVTGGPGAAEPAETVRVIEETEATGTPDSDDAPPR